MKDNDVAQDYGRVTAMRISRMNLNDKSLESVWLPQFELIKYRSSSGKTVSETFVCITDNTNKSGVVEFKSEMEALQFAVDYRDKL